MRFFVSLRVLPVKPHHLNAGLSGIFSVQEIHNIARLTTVDKNYRIIV